MSTAKWQNIAGFTNFFRQEQDLTKCFFTVGKHAERQKKYLANSLQVFLFQKLAQNTVQKCPKECPKISLKMASKFKSYMTLNDGQEQLFWIPELNKLPSKKVRHPINQIYNLSTHLI
jgi:hypothetical protein